MNWLALAAFAAWGACPYIAEVLPDPTEVEDSRGEFVEIRLPKTALNGALSVFYEQKEIWSGFAPDSAKRILLIRDSLLCPDVRNLFCDKLEGPAFPNRREMELELRGADCSDAAKLPVPKAGKSLVRSDSALGVWEFAVPTPGLPNAVFESDVQDCRLHLESATFENSAWKGTWSLSGCDSAQILAEFLSMESIAEISQTAFLVRGKSVPWNAGVDAKALRLKVSLPQDDVPGNDSLDTLLAVPGNFPVRLTEVHPCPEEGVPEWFEIYNAGFREVPLSQMNLCKTGKGFSPETSLGAGQSAVLTKDTASMRTFVGTDEILILQAGFGYLKNAADSLFLCYGSEVVDSAIWGKATRIQTDCPSGFSVLTGRSENSPGFQTPGSLAADTDLPFKVEWNARIFSRKNRAHPLMLRVQSEEDVLVELISGKGDLLWKRTFPKDLGGNVWREVPLIDKGFPGPNFIRVSRQNREKRFGVVLRP